MGEKKSKTNRLMLSMYDAAHIQMLLGAMLKFHLTRSFSYDRSMNRLDHIILQGGLDE